MTAAQEPVEVESVDTSTAGWSKYHMPGTDLVFDALPLVADPDTGMEIMKMIYPAGFTNPWHTHDCAHGIYVLDGTLTTHRGEFGAGSFVWFPEGGPMKHGASPDKDCTILFITNKPFDIQYL